MKRYDAMRLSGTVLLAHLALCAAFLLLLIAASGSTSTFTFRSPYGLVLGLLFIGLPAFAFGWGLQSAKNPFDKKLCWNAAMVLYVLNAAAFLLAPEFGTGNVIAMWWGVPMAPALAGLNAFAAPPFFNSFRTSTRPFSTSSHGISLESCKASQFLSLGSKSSSQAQSSFSASYCLEPVSSSV